MQLLDQREPQDELDAEAEKREALDERRRRAQASATPLDPACIAQALHRRHAEAAALYFKLVLVQSPLHGGEPTTSAALWLYQVLFTARCLPCRLLVPIGPISPRQTTQVCGEHLHSSICCRESANAQRAVLAQHHSTHAVEGRAPAHLWTAVRDVTAVEPPEQLQKAALSASGALLLITEEDDPDDISPRLHRLAAALPPASERGSVPLLVLVSRFNTSSLISPSVITVIL